MTVANLCNLQSKVVHILKETVLQMKEQKKNRKIKGILWFNCSYGFEMCLLERPHNKTRAVRRQHPRLFICFFRVTIKL